MRSPQACARGAKYSKSLQHHPKNKYLHGRLASATQAAAEHFWNWAGSAGNCTVSIGHVSPRGKIIK
jgi:hypothetical protein